MANIKRKANAHWTGDLRSGRGELSTPSGVLKDTAYSYHTRFEDGQGTNPEELVAAAHAGCFTMAFSNVLKSHGHEPRDLHTEATCVMNQVPGGFKLAEMQLVVRGSADGLDQEGFQRLAEEAEQGCPISGALRNNLAISVQATLE
ncbi:OsmC family protein [Deinococcus yavapaiensis]|nr:OsmC family protein [Deinococcus yavapaiensis]